jgi:hypothetical protein
MWLLIVIAILVLAVLVLAGRRQRRLRSGTTDPMVERDLPHGRPTDETGWGGWGNGGGAIGS